MLPFRSRRPRASDVDDDDAYFDEEPAARRAAPPAKPSVMQGREPLYGYLTAAVIAVTCILDLTITTGKGAPAHPTVWPSYIGLALAIGLAGSIQIRNRLLSPFIAIFGAFFATLEKGPDRLSTAHIFTLVAAVGFAVMVTMRQRKEQQALRPRGARGSGRAAAATGSSGSRASGRSGGRRRRGEPVEEDKPKRPAANRRYTPPKAAKPPPKAGRR